MIIVARENSSGELEGDINWSAIIWSRLIRVLRNHAFKVDVDRIFNVASITNMSETDVNSNIVQGEL